MSKPSDSVSITLTSDRAARLQQLLELFGKETREVGDDTSERLAAAVLQDMADDLDAFASRVKDARERATREQHEYIQKLEAGDGA